ncbi:hypothetical protein YC2023_009319 [Brassica napus]
MRGRGPRGGFPSSCGGDGSTSTNQHQKNIDVIRPSVTPENTPLGGGSPRTLEDMILQLEVEEDIVRRARLRESYYGSFDNCDDDDDNLYQPVRMSCVNSSDILSCVGEERVEPIYTHVSLWTVRMRCTGRHSSASLVLVLT